MKILDFWYFDEFKTENPARTAKSSVQRRKKRPESGINATQKEAAGNPTDSYFTIKRKKYQVFIRAIFIFFRKIILIFHYPPQGAATSQSPPYSRLPPSGKLSAQRTEEVNYLRFISGFPLGGKVSPNGDE